MLTLIVLASTFGAYFAYTAYGSTLGTNVLAKAASQVGVTESPLGSDSGPTVDLYTQNHSEPWCADFVSWVYYKAGSPFTGGASGWRIALSDNLRTWFRNYGYYYARSSTATTPIAGDVVWFDWDNNGTTDHVAIVDHVYSGTLYTISGNYSNSVKRASYANFRSYADISGWGRKKTTTTTATPVPTSANPYTV